MEGKSTISELISPYFNNVGNTLVSKAKGDRSIWAIVALLTLASLMLVYSSTGSLAFKSDKSNESFLLKQLFYNGLGIAFIYFLHRVKYTVFARIAKICFLISIPLMVYTLFFGVRLNEASRWIKLPVINVTFQSSDFAKLALFMFLSLQLSKKQADIKDFKKGFLQILWPVVLICALIAPANLSTSLLVFATSVLLMFIGRVSLKHIALLVGAGLIAGGLMLSLAVSYYDKTTKKQKELPAFLQISRVPTWIGRVQSFIYGKDNLNSDKLYQVNQAKIAVAKGGWTGRGAGKSQQRDYLPHCYSDFIFAIIIEEYGFIGAAVVLFLYLAFLFRCIRVFQRCPFAFGAFLSLALSFTLVIQALANAGVAVGLFPNTGVTLPLVSMGGSSILFTCMSIGIILSVARNVEKLEGTNEKEVAHA